MAITPFENIPGRGQDPSTFAARADDFIGIQLPRFVSEANVMAVEMAADASVVADAVSEAREAADTATLAVGAVGNFKGDWNQLSGSLAPPASVRHKGRLWLLLRTLPNVTLAEPGVDVTAWQPAQSGAIVALYNVQALPGDDIIHTSDHVRRVFLPAGPSQGDTVTVVLVGPGRLIVDRSGGTILGVAEDMEIDRKNWRLRFMFTDGTWRVSLEGLVA